MNGLIRRMRFTAMRLFAILTIVLAPCIVHAADEFLDPEIAFKFSAKLVDAINVDITFVIADGYYMYRDRFFLKVDDATAGRPIFPQGKVKFDETFQKDVETYRKTVTIRLPVKATGAFTLNVSSQGCSDRGLCYAPMDSIATLSANAVSGLLGAVTQAQKQMAVSSYTVSNQVSGAVLSSSSIASNTSILPTSESGRIEASLKSGKLLTILPLFLLLGLGLSFTPCVLPMVPILSSIIIGEGTQVRGRRGFVLAAVYSLGMALIYTALGIAAGLIGEGLAATLQNPWVLSAFAGLMVVLSLSMFGFYQLQVPASIQLKLMKASEQQAAGKLFGVFIMGAISALIVGPCVAAPLAGALVYISQTRDVLIGGSALFFMAIGMSVPLLLVGISAGSLLPRAGRWMEAVKRFFGVLMLAVALWMINPVIPAWAHMSGWVVLGIGYGAYLLSSRGSGWIAKAIGLVFGVIGIVQLVGVTTGGRDALAPLAHLSGSPEVKTKFVRVKSSAELDAALAQVGNKMVMLDFYADWCVSCIEMEKLTFVEPRVHAQLSTMVLLQIDVTANNADDKALLKRFGLFGPPAIIFFNTQGKEVAGSRVIGYQKAETFLLSLASASRR
jgi:thiol:disulfide interchange protein DsbD